MDSLYIYTSSSFSFSHTSTFQLLDKPWSQVSSLLPPVLAFDFYRAYLRVQQSHCSSIFHRVLLTHALARSASQFVHKKKFPRIHTSMHSAELTKLTYTRLEDNLTRHRGDRLYDGLSVRLRLEMRLLKAEVIDTLRHGCVTWSPNKPDYDRLRRVQHSMVLRCLGWRKRKRDHHTTIAIVRRCVCQDRLREHRGYCSRDWWQVVWEGGAPATEGDIWGAGWG